jgi:endonuclease III
MQESFDFATGDLAYIRKTLTRTFGKLAKFERRDPIWRMVRSLIGSQTYDIIAEPAFERMKQRWPHPQLLAATTPAAVLAVIHDVNHAEDKAENLIETLRRIGRERPDYDLSFLRAWSVRDALSWLERLPGVGPKVAAATLNASTLRMRVFIVDSHVHRILLRFGFIGAHASAEQGRDTVTGAAGALDADDLLELFAQMKRLGQTLCRPFEWQCRHCPLASRCRKKVRLGMPARRNRASAESAFLSDRGEPIVHPIPRGDADRRLRGLHEQATRRT